MKLSRILIAPPALALALVIALANRGPVTLSLDPFSAQTPIIAFDVPLYLLIFVALLLGVLIGGSSAWVGQTGWRKKARTSARKVKHLSRDLNRARGQEEAQTASAQKNTDTRETPERLEGPARLPGA